MRPNETAILSTAQTVRLTDGNFREKRPRLLPEKQNLARCERYLVENIFHPG